MAFIRILVERSAAGTLSSTTGGRAVRPIRNCTGVVRILIDGFMLKIILLHIALIHLMNDSFVLYVHKKSFFKYKCSSLVHY